MLSYLRIRGLALLDDVTLQLSPGMNVLTGETGAGKSIIVDALALLRGARARSGLLRSGAEALTVDAQFELTPPIADRLAPLLEAHGLPADDRTTLVLRRVVPRTGRGRCFVQAELTTQAVLAEVGEVLIDICSQHEHHSLAHVARHLELLDSYARVENELADYAAAYREYRAASVELEQLRTSASQGTADADYLNYQIEELERIAPKPGEYDSLRRRLELLRHAQRWADFARAGHDLLYENEDSVAGQLASMAERARRGASHSERLATVAEQLAAAAASCEEADRELLRFLGELELEPGELEQAEERLSELAALQRKHSAAADQLGDRLEAMRAQLEALSNAQERIADLEARASSLRARALQRALALRQTRDRARAGLSQAVVAELGALHIAHARFDAGLEPLPEDQLGPRGLDRIQFLFCANPGEPLAPLSRVASGGELSRVLLAVKGVLSIGDRVATYVFDEIDAGVGGAVAVAIGQRLSRAAQQHQVLCTTHLPQIAAHADAHYRVDKRMRGGRTTTLVAQLSNQERIEELARMLGGSRVTETARTHARQLLREAAHAVAAPTGHAQSRRRGSTSLARRTAR
jgi:DNA repair protein RecN (Recombination protein N)